MIHHMKLDPSPFHKIFKGEKTIELRLYDLKRQKIKVGDYIEFSNTKNKLKNFRTRVVALHLFPSFEKLYQNLSLKACGYDDVKKASPKDMEKYYTLDEQEKYGVVGIEIEVVDREETEIEATSRYIAMVLRHKPSDAGLTLDKNGWTNVNDLIKGVNKKHHLTMEILEKIVATNDKQRFSFNEDKTLIRANQGHSIAVDVELTPVMPPDRLWHGTAVKYIESIDAMGLHSQNRLYVHLSEDYQTALRVGKRHGESVVYSVNSAQMHADGYVFYKSANGVWLTKIVPVVYLER